MANEPMNEYLPKTVSHPGGTLNDILEEQGMSQAELAERTGRPKKTINEIINGKTSIMPETAIQLERVLGVPASFWNARQRRYDEYIARVQEEQSLQKSLEWLKLFPLKEMISYGYIHSSNDKVTILRNILNFAGVATPEAFQRQVDSMAILYRKSARFDADPLALSTWLRKGKLEAEKIQCVPYNRQAFINVLPKLRSLSKDDPKTFVPELKKICAECGVAVVFIPELPKIQAFGASYWLGDRPVIQLCFRGKKDDVLWFTFYHEAAHIILHERKRAIFLETEKHEGEEEMEANKYASELLIPKAELDAFVIRNRPLSQNAIIEFANQQGIAPSIVVGQLHHYKYAPYTHFHRLRRTFAWKHE